jgi:hypothetical protein
VRSKRHRRQRSYRQIAVPIVVVILAGLGGGGYLAYASLKTRAGQLQAALTVDLQAGQKELEAGKAGLTSANNNHDPALVVEAQTHFAAAKRHFQAAVRLADNSRLLHYVEYVPVAGDQARSQQAAVDGIAGMGVAISDAGRELAGLDGQLIQPPSPGPAGRTLLTVLADTHTSLAKVRGDLVLAQTSASKVDVKVLPSSQQAAFVKARTTIDTALSGLDEFDLLVPVMTEVLGGSGPRTYLVEQVNPAELRAGGGFIGTYSLLRADQGKLSVIKSGDAYDLANPRPLPGQPGFIPLPTPYREVIPQVSWSFVDSNIYPDFSSNARAAEQFVQPRLGFNVDAVIAMDYYTVAKMLELTGPLAVPGYGVTVDANSFVASVIQADIAGSPTHKAILGAIAGPLMERVSALPPDRWPALIQALNTLAAERHLQAYFNSDSVQKEIDRVGWSGGLILDGTPDYMMEVESNYYGNKDNYFIARHYTVVLTREGGTLHHKVTVDLANGTPYGSYVRTEYRADTRLFVSSTATHGSSNLRGVLYPNPASPPGTGFLDGWLYVQCCNAQGSAVFEYDTPWLLQYSGVDQIYWQKQPGTLTDKVDVTWIDGSGHTYHASGDLGQDRVITLSPDGVTLTAGRPAQATLPSLSLG